MTTTTESPETTTATTTEPTWEEQFAQLKDRYPKVREPILVALHILTQSPDIELDDAKAQADVLGTRITAASVNAARRLLEQQDEGRITRPTPTRSRRGPRSTAAPAVHGAAETEALIRGMVAKIESQGSAEAEGLRKTIRKAIAMLEAAL